MNETRLTIGRRLTLAVLVCAGAVSCQDQNYRIEVQPGPQGQTVINRIPLTPDEQARRQRIRQMANAPLDSDLASIEAIWPVLSPSDRAAVVDLAKRSAAK